jgi:hypothetical protein
MSWSLMFFLAVLEKEQQGGVEMDWSQHGYKKKWYEYEDEGEDEGGGEDWHELDDIYETKYRIKRLVTLTGAILRFDYGLDDDELENNVIPACDDDPFEDVEGEEEYEGYMGNSVCVTALAKPPELASSDTCGRARPPPISIAKV